MRRPPTSSSCPAVRARCRRAWCWTCEAAALRPCGRRVVLTACLRVSELVLAGPVGQLGPADLEQSGGRRIVAAAARQRVFQQLALGLVQRQVDGPATAGQRGRRGAWLRITRGKRRER